MATKYIDIERKLGKNTNIQGKQEKAKAKKPFTKLAQVHLYRYDIDII